MTSEANKKLILDYFEASFNRRDDEAVKEHLAQDFVDHTAADSAAILQRREVRRQAFPDLRVSVEDIVSEGDRVAVRTRWTGTQSGALPNLPPTNRSFSVTGMGFFSIRDGKIAEHWAVLDRSGIQRALAGKPS
jgi:steroid delta-isomerase-like uncharacterized protein